MQVGGGGFHHRVGDKGAVRLIPPGRMFCARNALGGSSTIDGGAGQISTIGTRPSVQMGGEKAVESSGF